MSKLNIKNVVKFNRKREVIMVSEAGDERRYIHENIRLCLTSPVSFNLLLISWMGLSYSTASVASVSVNHPSYQTYRDFAENKGAFYPGAKNIPLFDTDGSVVSVLNSAPMIDFSSNDRTGVATLISPQYVVSVKHNGGYQNVKFGYGDDTTYSLVDRNNDPKRDFHTPRLNKIVTEVIPLDTTNAGTAKGTYKNVERFPVYYRVGTGTQYVSDTHGKITHLMGAYSYKTGGIVNAPVISDTSFVTNTTTTPLSTYGTPGDSGSPLFAWDAQQHKWVLTAVLNAYAGMKGNTNWYTIIPAGDVSHTMTQDADAHVKTKQEQGEIHWSYDENTGLGSLTQGSTAWSMHGILGATLPASLNSGKDLTFQGGGTVVLENTVNQGAGALIFNNDYTVKPLDSQTWKGGGIIVNGDRTVDWKVKGMQSDDLHKLGTGTLKINGTGVNPGGLNVGEGTVVLSQRPDGDGNVQAFKNVSIVSGRPTVVLSDEKQVNPDSIKWGYRGGKLDINGNNLTFHKLNGADDGAVLTNSGSLANVNLDFNKPDATNIANIWHGHFTGNIEVSNVVTPGTKNDFVIDGGVDTQGSITQQNGRLFMQGHPVVHAVSSQALANKLKALGDNSVLTQPVSFSQTDWQNRQFSMAELNLQNADFNLARNASLNTVINAESSAVTLGSDDLYIDLNDGNGVKITPKLGQSKATAEEDLSRFSGRVQLRQGSTLTVNDHFTGGIDSTDSATSITSTNALLSQFSRFTQSSLSLAKGAKLATTAGLFSDGTIKSDAGATLSLLSEQPGTTYSAQRWELTGQNTTLNVGDGIVLNGNLYADASANINFGTENSNLSTVYYGDIHAPLASATLKDTDWEAHRQSAVKSLTLNGAKLSFSNGEGLGSLTADTLMTDNSTFIMNVDGKAADTVTVSQTLAGNNNRLFVVPTAASVKQGASAVPLVTAPKETQSGVFTLNPVSLHAGLHNFTPKLEVLQTDTGKQWRLQGFDVQPDKRALRAGKSFMDVGYKNFITEINNLKDRMGDLRHTHGETGVWARINNASGSSSDGFSGSYTHLQIGADRKQAFEGGDLFTGVTATFTNSANQGTGWSGKTNSTGIGVYASAMFDSGLYTDVIGKYVRHDNHYSSNELGMPEQNYGSHSWYLGTEVGWRFFLPGEAYIQPQTELVYGTVTGNRFAWQFNDSEIKMQRKQMQPLIGRTGIESGKTFRGKDWELTALAGVSYQYDLFKPEKTVLEDLSGDTSIKNGKDNRMVFNIGINGKIKENTRISLNIERSEFGHYNIDKLINANFRYTF